MLSPLIVHAFPYAAFIPPCSNSSIVIIIFMKKHQLMFLVLWHIIIAPMQKVEESEKCKNQTL
jgi:hypothetical protein